MERVDFGWGDDYGPFRLGGGTFGQTYLLQDRRTGERVAVKYIRRGPKHITDNVERELLNHRKLTGHPNIIAFKKAFLTSTHLAIAMEYAAGGELYDRLHQSMPTEDQARFYFQQLVCGLTWCHSQAISHRDIKLENTLLAGADAAHLKIADLGYSKDSSALSNPNSAVGSVDYMAPEVFAHDEPIHAGPSGEPIVVKEAQRATGQHYHGESADVWSCGVLLYTLLVGSYPFRDPAAPKEYDRTIKRIQAVQYDMPPTVPQGCRDLLRRIFVADPARRITLAAIQQHPWFLTALPDWCRDGNLAAAREAHRRLAQEMQSEAELVAIVAQARAPLPDANAHDDADAGLGYGSDEDDPLYNTYNMLPQ